MRELSVSEQRYQAVLAVISEGETVTDVAARWGVARKTLHAWLAKYEAGGLEGLGDGSHRPRSCPHQMPAEVEVALAEMRRAHPSWGPRRLVFELAKRELAVPSESAVYRCLVRLSLIVSHPGFDAVLVPWLSGSEKETVCHGTSPEVFR